MQTNIIMAYPPADGAAMPPTEMMSFGNDSGSTRDSLQNYDLPNALVNPVSSYVSPRYQIIKSLKEYPR